MSVTRNRLWLRLAVLATVLGSSLGFGGQEPVRPPSAASATPAAVEMLFKPVVVQNTDGQVLSGYLLGIAENALVIKRSGTEESVPLSVMKRVIIDREKKGLGYALAGAGLGAFFYNVAFAKAEGQPPIILGSGGEGSDLIYLLMVCAGGSLGYFAGPLFEASRAEFVLDGTPQERTSAWESLRRFVLGVFSPPHVHLNLHGGSVGFRISNQYERIFRQRGFVASPYYYSAGDSGYADPAGSINLLRRIQASVSLSNLISVGLSFVNLSEPRLTYVNNNEYLKTLAADLSLTAQGYFVVGSLEPLRTWFRERFVWEIGLGAGWVKTKFGLKTYLNFYGPAFYMTHNDYEFDRTDFGGMIFSELRYYFNSRVALGVSADYLALRSVKVPAFPDIGLPAQTVRLGNSSLGLTLGIHF